MYIFRHTWLSYYNVDSFTAIIAISESTIFFSLLLAIIRQLLHILFIILGVPLAAFTIASNAFVSNILVAAFALCI